jgi:tripeptide aminopeptidase
MDTVKATAGINLIVEEGLIKTDGTTILGGDDKVGIAAILEAIHILKESEIKHGNLEIIFTSGEEAGLFGAKYLNIKSLESKLGFVFDSGGPVGRIIVSAPTEKDFDIEVKGRAAHAGVEPEKGISAIEVGSDIINQLNLGRIDEETTANIGIIEGGEATNIVADRLYIKGEARSRNTDKLDNLLKEIKKVCKEKESKWGVEVELIIQKAYSGFDLTRRDKVVKIAMEAIKGLGLEAKLRPRGGGSDANIFNARGIPTVNLGIGVENDHTTKERIAIDDLVNCASLAVEVIKNIGK